MYIPSAFEEHRPGELQRVMRDFPLGALITQGPCVFQENMFHQLQTDT